MCIESITSHLFYILCIRRKMDDTVRFVSVNTPSDCEFLGIYDRVLSDLEDIDINDEDTPHT